MKLFNAIFMALWIFFGVGATQADAAPITAFFVAAGFSAATAAAITNIVVGLAFNALSMAFMKKPKYDAGGIKVGATQTGEDVAQGFILRPV